MSEANRRFTDREVALVLKQASELEEEHGAGVQGGLSLDELHEIAREVGISTRAVEQAVATLDRPHAVRAGLAGAPLVRKAVAAVPGRLSDEGIARLVRVVDEHAASAGSVSEALGSVRWTTSDRFRSTAVSITPSDDETAITVVEKTPPRLRRIFHFLPPAWALMVATPAIGAMQLPGAGSAAAVGAALLLGAGVGRGAWNLLSRRSEARVRELTAAVTAEGQEAVRQGLVLAPARPPETSGESA